MDLFKIFSKKPTIAVHNGSFHSDDVFACAALSILLGGRRRIIRTRDENIIGVADFVVDVGGVHDPEKNRFDHHQIGGAGTRDNGIPYAAFGLVWKKYGEELCGSKEIAGKIDTALVQPIDAGDNGVAIIKPLFEEVFPYELYRIVKNFLPTWKEKNMNVDRQFLKACRFAEWLLEREIKKMNDASDGERFAKQAYEQSQNKKIIILGGDYPWEDVMRNFPEPLYVVYSGEDGDGNWRVKTVRENSSSFNSRKLLPENWAGLRDQELQRITGVADAVFCHTKRFVAVAKSKEGALALAELALNG